MKKEYFRLLSLVSFFLGFFLLKLKKYFIGAVIGVPNISSSFNSIFGIILIFVSVILFIFGESLEERTRKIRSKKELLHLTQKQKTFRRKLINLFGLQKPVELKKIAYLLPQYDKVRYTGEHIPAHNYPVYLGRRGSKEEYFTVDTREAVKVKLGDDTFLFPEHIDIQERLDKSRYRKISKEHINWNKMIEWSESQDIIDYFQRKGKRNRKRN